MYASFHAHANPLASDSNPLVRKIGSVFPLTDDERQALENLPMQLAVLKDHQDIVREGDRPSRSFVILSGFTCTYKITAGGKRQIVTFGMAGDIPDLQSLHLKVLDISVGTLTQCRVGFSPMRPCATSVSVFRASPPRSGARP